MMYQAEEVISRSGLQAVREELSAGAYRLERKKQRERREKRERKKQTERERGKEKEFLLLADNRHHSEVQD